MNNHTAVAMRIANFSDLELSLNPLLDLDLQNVPSILAELRKYADLPYGFLFTVEQKGFVKDLLLELRKIRSACFPYALFFVDDSGLHSAELEHIAAGAEIITIDGKNQRDAERAIVDYAQNRFVFDNRKLQISSSKPVPKQVDVVVVGAGVSGLYAAQQLAKNKISYCVVDQRDICGGIWSRYANATSQVNTSEGGYRLVEKKIRSNRDHSTTREI